MRRRIVLDIDGVACAHAIAVCNRVNADYGVSSEMNDVTTWDHDFGPITFKQAVEKYYPDSAFIRSMPVSDGFADFLTTLSCEFDMFFATSRNYSQAATKMWVKEKFGSEYNVLFVSENKATLDFFALVDDYPGEILAAAEANKFGILIRRPWNDNEDVRRQISEVNQYAHIAGSFDEAIAHLKGVAGSLRS